MPRRAPKNNHDDDDDGYEYDDDSINDNDNELYASARKLVLKASERQEAMAVHSLVKSRNNNSDHDDGNVNANDNDNLGRGGTENGNTLFSMKDELTLKEDHPSRPCWVCPDGTIYLEAFHEFYAHAYEFLVAIAEPVSRPEFLHQYRLTQYSLYAAVATNIDTKSILGTLQRLSKNILPNTVKTYIQECTSKCGKVKLVLKHNKLYLESEDPSVLQELLKDPIIARARVYNPFNRSAIGAPAAAAAEKAMSSRIAKKEEEGGGSQEREHQNDNDDFITNSKAEEMKENLKMLKGPPGGGDDDDDDDDDMDGDQLSNKLPSKKTVVSFEIDPCQVEHVKRQALEMEYPLMEEYDFRNDTANPSISNMILRPETKIRHYQERALSKMFGNGRARSGIIVLPCGAGKTLTGVTAAQTIRKSCICLATSSVSVLQWKHQFQKWTNIPDDQICAFTSDQKDPISSDGRACVVVTTYNMLGFAGNRTQEAQKMLDQISNREWGLLLMDEVHVVPAKTFRKVIGIVKAHCKLGLTATLVRQDNLISDLNFLVGPKLYEANWMDLTAQGYLANVKCAEMLCPLPGPFMKEYLATTKNSFASSQTMRDALCALNPNKLRLVEYLVRFHEARGDKIIIFSDMVYALKKYAKMLGRPMIYGETPEKERRLILGVFRSTPTTNNKESNIQTICLSKIGDTSIDIPEANVIIQVSFHFGARRQEAQRLGRILRPKQDTAPTCQPQSQSCARAGAGAGQGPNKENAKSSSDAYFYTLISSDTQEAKYNGGRQQYLIDQGYTYSVVSDLYELANKEATNIQNDYNPEKDGELLQEIKEELGTMATAASDKKKKRTAAGAVANPPDGPSTSAPNRHSLFKKRQRK